MVTDSNLPAVAQRLTGTPVRMHGPGVPAVMRDAVSDLRQAWDAVRQLDENGSTADVSAVLQAAVVGAGATSVEALQAVVDFMRGSPGAEIQSIAWLRQPGPEVGAWEYQATVALTFPSDGPA